jgi:hypothetical protein
VKRYKRGGQVCHAFPKGRASACHRLLVADYVPAQPILDQRTPKLEIKRGRSTDLYIQKDSPGADKKSNWLPAPSGDFILMLRLYWPDESNPSILNGSWKIPAVAKV